MSWDMIRQIVHCRGDRIGLPLIFESISFEQVVDCPLIQAAINHAPAQVQPFYDFAGVFRDRGVYIVSASPERFGPFPELGCAGSAHPVKPVDPAERKVRGNLSYRTMVGGQAER